MNKLMLVPVSQLSATMRDIANIFQIARGNCVMVEEQYRKDPSKARTIYDQMGNGYDKNTRLPLAPPRR